MRAVFARAGKLAGLIALASCLRIAAGAPPCAARAAAPDSVAEVLMLPDTVARMVSAPGESGEFPVLIGAFATTLVGSVRERTENVRLAAAALDGRVLEPGEVLGFNACVGPRTIERGYLLAPVILHERRQVQTGGGICQVASTLFVAALQAGFSTVERWRHSTPVDYIALGEDATIAWGAKDLRLRNDTGRRVRVRCTIVGSTLAARLDADAPTGATYELVSEVRELPPDPGVAGARAGREIELFRVRREDGRETAREFLHRDVFPPTRGPQGERR